MADDVQIIVDLADRSVWRDGRRLVIQAKAFDLLALFVRNPNRLLTKAAILRAVWPDTYVTDASVKDCVKQLRLALQDDATSPTFIVTERGHGYRYLGGLEISASADNSDPPDELRAGILWRRFAAVVAVLLTCTALWYLTSNSRDFAPAIETRMAYGLPEQPSIAVIPFTDISDDADMRIFARGISDDMTTALGRMPQLFVSARGAVKPELYQDLPNGEIAEHLGVRYLLNGSVQQVQGRIRVSAKLIDALEGRYLWTRRYEDTPGHFFSIQDKIVLDTLIELRVQFEQGQRARIANDTQDLQSWLASSEAYSEYLKFRPETNAQARRLWLSALEHDGARSVPHAGIAFTHYYDAWRGWSADRQVSIDRGLEHARIAIRSDPYQPLGYQALGSLEFLLGHTDEAVRLKRKAVELAPNDFSALGGLAAFLPGVGAADEAVVLFRRAIRVNPTPPVWVPVWYGHALHVAGDPQAAAAQLEQAIIRQPDAAYVHARLAAIQTDMGEIVAARASVARALEIDPAISIGQMQTIFSFTVSDQTKWFRDLLSRAGMPV